MNMEPQTLHLQNSITGQWLTERHFSDNARRMIRDVHARATDRGMFGELPPVLILWALLRWERNLAINVLERCGVNTRQLEADVERELNASPAGESLDGFDLFQVRRIAEEAVDEAECLGDRFVGPEHLVLALCRDRDAVLSQLFASHNVTADDYRAALRQAQTAR